MRCAHLFPLVALLASLSAGHASAAQEHGAGAVGSASPTTTQEEPERPLLQAGLGLMLAVPLGDFRENVDFAGGFTGHLDFGLGRSPISVGAEATYLWYGDQSRNVPLVGMPDLTVGVSTANDMFLLHGRVRAQRPDGRVRPYVDGLVGFNYLATTTTVDAEETCHSIGSTYWCDGGGDSVTNLDDIVLSVGGGAGVQFAFGASPHSMRLDVSARYLYGGEAEYLTEDDMKWTDAGPVALQPRRSRTDVVLVNIGLVWGR